jgi:hypothetical protein
MRHRSGLDQAVSIRMGLGHSQNDFGSIGLRSGVTGSGGRRTKIHGGPKNHMINQTKDRKNQRCIEFKFYI